MADARNVGGDLDTIGQPNASDFTKCRVRLLGCLREYPHAHTTLLRTPLKRWALRLGSKLLSPLADELTDGRHEHSIDRLHSITLGIKPTPIPSPECTPVSSCSRPKNDVKRRFGAWKPEYPICVFVRGLPRNHSGEETLRGDGSKPQPPLPLLPLRRLRLPMRLSGAR